MAALDDRPLDIAYEDIEKLTPRTRAKKIEESKKKEDIKSFMYRNAKSGSIYNPEKLVSDIADTFFNTTTSKPLKTLKIKAEELAKEQFEARPIVNGQLVQEKINEMISKVNQCCSGRLDNISLILDDYNELVSKNLKVLTSKDTENVRENRIKKESKKKIN